MESMDRTEQRVQKPTHAYVVGSFMMKFVLQVRGERRVLKKVMPGQLDTLMEKEEDWTLSYPILESQFQLEYHLNE